MLPDYVPAASGGSTATATGSATTAGPTDVTGGTAPPGALATAVGATSAAFDVFLGQLDRGVRALEPRRLYHVLLRSGRIPGVDYGRTGGYTVELALIEAAPVVAGLLVAPVAVRARSVRDRSRPGLVRRDPVRATDLFAVVYVAVFGLLYLPRLPLHSTITVRYLVPVVPFMVYGVCRLAPVHRVVEFEGRRLAASTVLLTVAFVALAATGLAGTGPGTAMQAHAVANLAVAGLFATWLAVALRSDVDPRIGAAVLALVLAVSVSFLLLSGVEYFGRGRQFALPVARSFEQLLPVR
jgi:hypothetical protein